MDDEARIVPGSFSSASGGVIFDGPHSPFFCQALVVVNETADDDFVAKRLI